MKTTKTKRLLAACLALMLTIGLLATGVFAAKNTTVSDVKEKTGSDGQIVVTVYNQDPGAPGTGAEAVINGTPVDGVGINALRIGSVVELTTSTTDDAASSTPTVTTQVAFGLNQDMAALLGLNTNSAIASKLETATTTYYFTPAAVQTALSTKNNAEDGQDAIEQYLSRNSSINRVTDSTGVATFNDLSYGLYLLAKSELPAEATTDLTPFLVSVPMYVNADWTNTVYAYPKVRTEKIQPEKTAGAPADDSYVSAGDTIPFTITMTIPAEKTGTGGTMNFESFVITDTNVSSTLVVDTDSIVVKLDSKSLEKPVYDQNDPPVLTSGDYEVSYEHGILTITLTANGLGKINADMADAQTLTVTYNATVATGVTFSTKLTNNAVLKYNRGSGEVTSDVTTVNLYTYGLDLTKTLSDGGAITADTISFELYKDDNGHQGAKIPVVARNGNYWVAAEEEEPAVTMFVGTNGKLNLYGLEPGTYYLKELATQDGYTLLDSPITIVISTKENPDSDPTVTATVNDATAQVENGVVYLQVENTKNDGGFNLPQTGGAGTLLATAIGLGLLCAGVVLLVAYRKKSHG